MANNLRKALFHLLIFFFLFCALCSGIYFCFQKYVAWGKIPYHHISAKLKAEGLISKDSHSSFNLVVDVGDNYGLSNVDSSRKTTLISVHNGTKEYEFFPENELYTGNCRYVYFNYSNKFEHKYSFYFLEYQYESNIPGAIKENEKAGMCVSDEYTLSYIEYPHGVADKNGVHFKTNGLLAFAPYECIGSFDVVCGILNEKPKTLSNWDITQANFNIEVACENISCDTLSMDFIGATSFSAMNPMPDKTTYSSIEFTNPTSINEIMKNGLQFHADFIQMKELSARRSVLLSAALSLLISLLGCLLYDLFVVLRRNKKLPSVDGTDGSDGMMETATGVS